MDFRAELIRLVECYTAATKRSEARTANLAGRDSRFFARLREGKGCTADTLAHMRQWFSDTWPAGAEWPEGIARPAPTRAPVTAAEAA